MEAKDTFGFTPLILLADQTEDDYITAEMLINEGADLNTQTEDGFTALHKSVIMGAENITSLLIKKGAAINKKSKIGVTALHDAVSCGHIEMVELLIENGAKINAKDQFGFTPLMVEFEDHVEDQERGEVIEALIRNGADIDAKDNSGKTALYQFTKTGDLHLVRILLENGADVNVSSEEGTPLQVAIKNSNSAIANLLREYDSKE